MMKFESVKAHDGVILRVARIEPSSNPLGVIQIIHGFGEGLVHYKDVTEFFADNGYACVIHDQRGFGEMPDLSPKQRQKARGVVPGYKYLIEDIKTLRDQITQWYPNLPVTLFGHSMGGNLVVNYLLENDGYNKAILEAPWLRLYKPLPKSSTVIANMLGKISKNITVSANMDMEDAPHKDDIFHDRMSLRLYSAVVKAGEYAIKNAEKITVPTLLLCPCMDKLVCVKTIREFAANANDNVVLKEYPQGNHCLHSDAIKDEVLADMLEFIMKE